jgi:hypothetical protein
LDGCGSVAGQNGQQVVWQVFVKQDAHLVNTLSRACSSAATGG